MEAPSSHGSGKTTVQTLRNTVVSVDFTKEKEYPSV